MQSFHSELLPTSTMLPETLFSSTLSAAIPVSSSTTELHHQNGLSDWPNAFTLLLTVILLFCLIVFLFSLLFLLSFRRVETVVKSTTTDKGNSKNTTIGMGNSRKCRSTFTIISDDKNDAHIDRSIGTGNTTTPCAITSLEDDQRQADEVEKEMTLFSTSIRSMKYVDASIQEDQSYRSLGLTIMPTNHHSSLKELRKHNESFDNDEKYHNSYSEVIEELKNRFEVFSTAV
ncbi:hypothetical protein BLA29_001027 [Euroglyphus maynei]|uniref:Uncharacterized protein n=1 Tax=Euroglyphus maynei TaxID=6958 RepID=A0A1Y3BP25_EURMA|nr:hypothetical protein BLA29_001027 [Euroglyphus maynei]